MPFKKGQTSWNKGKNFSKEIRKKMRISHIGKKLSEETINKILKSRKGYKHSEETKEKMSKTRKGKKRPPFSEEWKQKMSKAFMGRKPTKGSFQKGHKINWKGGLSYQPYPEDWTDILRDSIRQRDNYICQLCGIHQEELIGRFKKLDCHHINYDKDNLNPNNLISLCRSCHIKTNGNRDYWIEYFNN